MASERKIEANRANGCASQGPKTAQGKARSSQNARRHGLSLSVLADPALSKEIEDLARDIAGTTNPVVLDAARAVAEAEIDLMRIRRVRRELLAQNIMSLNHASTEMQPGAVPLELFGRLLKIDRYEQRAVSRSKCAVRRLDLARQECVIHDNDA